MTLDSDTNNPEDEDKEYQELFETAFDELDELGWLPSLIDQSDLLVPEELHSCFTDAPFANCLECGCEILESGTTYVIQKARRGGETVLELAMCLACAQSVQGSMSAESKATMEEFMANLMPRAENHTPGTCLNCCREVDSDEDEYEIAGLALGPILLTPLIMFCSECHEELEENLSEETKKGGEEFIEKNFPGIPADMGLPISFLGG
jgi:hypothetical protein